MTLQKLIAGNWKMFKTVPEALALVHTLKAQLATHLPVDVMVAPPYTALHAVHEVLEGTAIALGAQEVFYESQGAFTGAISGAMLRDVGCAYVLVGHSERRQHFSETLETSHKRMQAALQAGLVPILCIGETLDQRSKGETERVVREQFLAATQNLAHDAAFVVAYEPVWAIGTGKVATTAQAQELHAFIRTLTTAKTRILYGGSVNPENARELMEQQDIDGVLVGGASLDAQSFLEIIKAAMPRGSYENWFDRQFES
jgi:triosephosphate isomerase (TIM)